MRNVINDSIVKRANPLGVDAKWEIDKEQAEEVCKEAADSGFATDTRGPA